MTRKKEGICPPFSLGDHAVFYPLAFFPGFRYIGVTDYNSEGQAGMAEAPQHLIEVVYTVRGEIGPSRSRIRVTEVTVEEARRVLSEKLAPQGKMVDTITSFLEVDNDA